MGSMAGAWELKAPIPTKCVLTVQLPLSQPTLLVAYLKSAHWIGVSTPRFHWEFNASKEEEEEGQEEGRLSGIYVNGTVAT